MMLRLRQGRTARRTQFLGRTAHEMAIFDSETKLLALWYLKRRWKEESARSSRYGCPLSMVVVSDRGDDTPQLRYWLLTRLRLPDMVSRRPDRRYIVVLPETDHEGAPRVATRLQSETGCKSLAVLTFPDDREAMERAIC